MAPRKERKDEVPPPASTVDPTEEQIAALAYVLWQERGCPHGSPEVDWLKAETQLRLSTGETDPSLGIVDEKTTRAGAS